MDVGGFAPMLFPWDGSVWTRFREGSQARCTNKTGKDQRAVLLNGNEPIRLPEMVGEGD